MEIASDVPSNSIYDDDKQVVPDDTFKEFVPDQLGALPELRARA